MVQTILKKDGTANILTKKGVKYSYTYSTLAEIHRYLELNNLRYYAFIQKVDGEDYMFIQRLKKEQQNGDFMPFGTPLQGAKVPTVNGVQEYGSILTSVRRFSLLMVFGLASEDGEPSPEEKWQKFKTPNPDKPATQKQIDTIRKLAVEAELAPSTCLKYAMKAKKTNQAEASRLIKELVNLKNGKYDGNSTT